MTKQEREALLRKVAELCPLGGDYSVAGTFYQSKQIGPGQFEGRWLKLQDDIEDAPAMVLMEDEIKTRGWDWTLQMAEDDAKDGSLYWMSCDTIPYDPERHIFIKGLTRGEVTARAFVAVMEAQK